MTSWHGNACHITGLLWWESTGHQWISLTKGQWCRPLMGSGVACLATNPASKQWIEWSLIKIWHCITKPLSKIFKSWQSVHKWATWSHIFCVHQRSKLQLIKPPYIQLSVQFSRNLYDSLIVFYDQFKQNCWRLTLLLFHIFVDIF